MYNDIHKVNPKINLALTTGEPAGVGPEISLKTAIKYINHTHINIILIGCHELLKQTAYKCNITEEDFEKLNIKHIPVINKVNIGQLDINNSQYVLNILDEA